MCPGSVFRHSHSALAAQMLMLPSAAPLSRCVGAAAAAGAKKRTALTAPLPGLNKNPISVLVCESDAAQAAPWLPPRIMAPRNKLHIQAAAAAKQDVT